MRSVTRVSWH